MGKPVLPDAAKPVAAVLATLACTFLFLGLPACREITVQSLPRQAQPDPKENLIEAQKITTRQEAENIQAFVKRSGWPMQATPTGLRYCIYDSSGNPHSPKVERGDAVQLEYTLQLLTGEEIASSAKNGIKTVIVGKSDIESGLTEALLMLRRGDKAKVIIPSHLGYGFSGDGKYIPSGASLLYDIEVIDILIPSPPKGNQERPSRPSTKTCFHHPKTAAHRPPVH